MWNFLPLISLGQQPDQNGQDSNLQWNLLGVKETHNKAVDMKCYTSISTTYTDISEGFNGRTFVLLFAYVQYIEW